MNTFMIEPRLKEVLEERGKSLYWLAGETKIAYSTLFKFAKAQTHGVDYRVLDGICSALDCHPGDLLVRVEESNGKERPSRKPRRKAAKGKELNG